MFREALHVYAQMHAPEDWNRRHFAMSKSEVLSEEAKRLLGMLRRHWTEGDGAGRTELDTAKMVQHLAASLAELSWLARALGSDVGEWAASPEVTAQFQDMVTSLDGLSGPLFQIARALDRQTGLA
ncbi:MAG: hypothetical protein ACRDRH_21390 [Pseudonocardia sp.]